jgi:biotin-dependent carboxylase-like uncharacterized protein
MLRVFEPGAHSTVQDKGRYGYQQYGIPLCGALDQFAYRVANMLVGNKEDAAVLEITFLGPLLEIMADADIAVTGAEIPVSVNDKPVDNWASFRVRAGDILRVGQARTGCRAYLAVSGGFDVPLVMGSRSTYVGGKIGGHHGRPIAAGDVLLRGKGGPLGSARRVAPQCVPRYSHNIVLRAVLGPQDDFFDTALITFFESEFIVSSKADRMGYRLQGPTVTHREGVPKSIISEPSLTGGIQVPPDGQVIILLVEQTVGGYTKIATVISTDIPRIAQAIPGDKVRFERINLKDAHKAFRQQEELLQQIEHQLLV